jgi:hypothetical protein
MKLRSTSTLTWVIGLVLGVLGLLGHLDVIPSMAGAAFWLVFAGLAVMLVAPLLRGL